MEPAIVEIPSWNVSETQGIASLQEKVQFS